MYRGHTFKANRNNNIHFLKVEKETRIFTFSMHFRLLNTR